MTQHSFNIPDQSGASFLADLNNALQALASVSRGTTEPATMYAGQYWEDTTTNLLKRRNAANGGWIIVASMDETIIIPRASNVNIDALYYGLTVIATGTFTQTFSSAASLTSGWHMWYRNDGSGVITLDPNASETIDGVTTIALQPGDSCRIACTGSAFKTQGLSAAPITNSLVADVNLNNTSNYFDGPTVAQGNFGRWFASGTIVVRNAGGGASVEAKLWDGTTVIASAAIQVGSNTAAPISLSGFISSPAGNLRISAKDPGSAGTKMLASSPLDATAKASTITAFPV